MIKAFHSYLEHSASKKSFLNQSLLFSTLSSLSCNFILQDILSLSSALREFQLIHILYGNFIFFEVYD